MEKLHNNSNSNNDKHQSISHRNASSAQVCSSKEQKKHLIQHTSHRTPKARFVADTRGSCICIAAFPSFFACCGPQRI